MSSMSELGIQGAPREVLEADQKRAAEQQHEADIVRHEKDLKPSVLGTPGATPEAWEREKAGILAKDRAEQAAANKHAARRSQAGLYRGF